MKEYLEFLEGLSTNSDSKVLLLVLDGLGGLPRAPQGTTELEAARTPNLDALAERGLCGLHEPVAPGIAPGSGPGHLALFGYDPLQYQVGRGVLAALGIGFDLSTEDVAARGNFCTVDGDGVITDRRAGRISTDVNRRLVEKLSGIDLPGVELHVQTVKEHRLLVVLRGVGLSGALADTDPQATGKKPLGARALAPEAEQTARIVDSFVERAHSVLADEHPANMVLLRGFSRRPAWPLIGDTYGVRAAAIAGYPMYRGVARLVGMTVLETEEGIEAEIDTLERHWSDFDLFYVHFKPIDAAGEDGDFDRKVALIEEADAAIPRILALDPDVIVVTGDHSTPAEFRAHSWHPVPTIVASRICRPDGVKRFAERACLTGGLGPRFPAKHLMPLAMANAGRIGKFGA